MAFNVPSQSWSPQGFLQIATESFHNHDQALKVFPFPEDSLELHQFSAFGDDVPASLPHQLVSTSCDGAVLPQSNPQGQLPLLPHYDHMSPVPARLNDQHIQPMAPPRSRKRKAPTLRQDDWDRVKHRVIELHIHQNIPLPKVRETIESEFDDFRATIRQYRTRLTQWGLDKKIKTEEMDAIVRKRQKRRLVEKNKRDLVFEVRGSLVDEHKIDRYMQRNKIPENATYSPSHAASTPVALTARTVSERGSPAESPANFVASPMSLSTNLLPSTDLRTSATSPTPANIAVQSSPPNPKLSFDQSVFLSDDRQRDSIQLRCRSTDEELLRRHLSMSETQRGAEHPVTLHLLKKLGAVLIYRGRYLPAEEVLRTLVVRCRNKNGEEDYETLQAMCLMEEFLRHRGLLKKAQNLSNKILKIAEKLLMAEKPVRLHVMRSIMRMSSLRGRYKEAEKLCIQMIEVCKKVLGIDNPDTLVSMGFLVSTWFEQGRYQEAEELCTQVIETRKRVLGADHPNTLVSMAHLAVYQGRYKEVGELLVQVMETCKRKLGTDHPTVLISMAALAQTLKQKGEDEAALHLREECVRKRNVVVGTDRVVNGLTTCISKRPGRI